MEETEGAMVGRCVRIQEYSARVARVRMGSAGQERQGVKVRKRK
jgi:hypothetical protein